MELTSIQRNKVELIINHFDSNVYRRVNFKAPTGSGKTLMATYFLSSIIERYPSRSFIFVIATPSSSSLPYFFEQKINLYKRDLPFNKFEVEYIESPSSSKIDSTESTPRIIPQRNKVYIFGKSTFGKGRIFTEQGVIDDFVQNAKDHQFEIIYIRDEAHIGGKFQNDDVTKHFESLMQTNSIFSLNMTATPVIREDEAFVEIKESELNNPDLNEGKWLLKTTPVSLLDKDILDKNLLVDAIQKFREIKSEYSNLDVYIKPAMLIQVDNESVDPTKRKIFTETLIEIKTTLSDFGLSWTQYFGKNDVDSNKVNDYTLDDIAQINNDIDVVIFKIGPSIGWDIPRACLLLQLRNVSSETLSVQTLGRIKRNSYPGLAKNHITDKYYIYSNVKSTKENLVLYRFTVKKELSGIDLATIRISNKKDHKTDLINNATKVQIRDFLKKNKSLILQRLRDTFVLNEDGTLIYRIVRSNSNGFIVYSEIDNVFLLLKEIDRLISKKEKLFKNIESIASELFASDYQNMELHGNETIKKEYLQLVLLNEFGQRIEEIIKSNQSYNPSYSVELVTYTPQDYVEIYSSIPLSADFEGMENYLFDISKNQTKTDNQPLDSTAEEVAFNRLSREIYRLNDSVSLWCKNIRTSNISGEYLDYQYDLRNSYFDFIIRFKNGVFLYLEIKSKNDINPEKTQLLKKAYRDYFDKRIQTIFNYAIVISVWVIDDNGIIEHETFFDDRLFKSDLSTLAIKDLLLELSSY